MTKLLRSIVKTFTRGNHSTFTGTGRADETLSGLHVQHYGFSSVPPAGTEFYTIQYGNNNVSIAENDGSGKLENMTEGQVAIYSPDNQAIHIWIQPVEKKIIIRCDTGEVQIGDSGIKYALLNENFAATGQSFLTHTHPVSGSVTGVPTVVPGPLPEKTSILKAD